MYVVRLFTAGKVGKTGKYAVLPVIAYISRFIAVVEEKFMIFIELPFGCGLRSK